MTKPREPAPRCPVCGKPVAPDTRPFCSRRCADIDLGRWLTGQYRLPDLPGESEDARPPRRDDSAR